MEPRVTSAKSDGHNTNILENFPLNNTSKFLGSAVPKPLCPNNVCSNVNPERSTTPMKNRNTRLSRAAATVVRM